MAFSRLRHTLIPRSSLHLVAAVCGVLMLASCSTEKAPSFGKLITPNATVWTMQETGNYYCRGSLMFGRRPGVVMKQVQAIDRGYQPALASYCPDAHASKVAAASTSRFRWP